MGKIALLIPNSPKWRGPSRAEIYQKCLEEAGHETGVTYVGKQGRIPINNVIDYNLVLNHTMQCDPKQIRSIAEMHPGIVFVNINHSAIAQLERSPKYTARFTSCLFSARQVHNIWYASVDIHDKALSEATRIERCISLPAPGYTLAPREYKKPGETIHIVIGGRCDPIKNLLNQLIAISLSKLKVQVTFAMDLSPEVKDAIKLLGINAKVVRHLPHPKWIALLKTADVVMSASLSESFCFVAVEAMQIGVPTVTSSAISFSDPDMVANPNDPQSISDTLKLAVGPKHETYSQQAASIAEEAVRERSRYYLDKIQFLLGKSYDRC